MDTVRVSHEEETTNHTDSTNKNTDEGKKGGAHFHTAGRIRRIIVAPRPENRTRKRVH
jgi:hypothetical protein